MTASASRDIFVVSDLHLGDGGVRDKFEAGGKTPQLWAFLDYVAGEASHGIAHVSLTEEIPVGFGILTVDTIEQAIERAGTKGGNKGVDAALAAIQMANVLRQLEQ